MALFNLTDITFRKEERGPLFSLVDSKYKTNTYQYPEDLGGYDKGHYMIIYINEQINTQFSGTPAGDSPSVISNLDYLSSIRGATNAGQIVGSFVQNGPGVVNEIVDKLPNGLKEIGQGLVNLFGGASSSVGQVLGKSETLSSTLAALESTAKAELDKNRKILNEGAFLRKIRRTTDAIALYMPDTLNFTYNQAYSDISIFDQLGSVGTLAAAGSSAIDTIKNGGKIQAGNISSFLLQLVKEQGSGVFGAVGNIGLAALGIASNPGLELIYTSPQFRSFRFDFMFYPRSENEAEQVMKIINRLKFHQAPEISAQTGGRFLIPPSEFDIKFYYNGHENENIPKISTCVLETIDVDYAPNGFSAYEVPGVNIPSLGRTGTPVGIRMSLQFKETQILTKDDFLPKGFVTTSINR